MLAKVAIAATIVFGALFGPLRAQVDARMFRFPDVSATHITFVYAGDIWVVEKVGGTARRLSSPPGEESFPRFSPDGTQIAFTGNYDGNGDVYVIPTLGGQPARVTYHPGDDRLVDWTPNGQQLLFASARQSGIQRFNQLHLVPASGGLPAKLPIPYGEFGALAADGQRLAYTPKSREFRTWKRYRGGMAPDIWLFDLTTNDARNVTTSDANESQPMWRGQTLYFLSDRGSRQRANIWAYELDGGRMRQVTHFRDFDISFPAIGPTDIVFQAGGRLYLLDLTTEQPREVSVDVVTDRAALRPRTEPVSELIMSAGISPTGKRAVFEARGEIFTVPAAHGVVRQLTHSSGAAERTPAWSPDGRHLAYWSDRSGEYELTLRAADGSDEERTLTRLGPGFRYQPFWSPDSKKLAFIDQAQQIQMYDLEAERVRTVDEGLWMLHTQLASFEASWSGDSRWLAYARGLETSNTAVFLYDTHTDERHQVTSGYYSDRSPVFDPGGDYLYYLTSRTLEAVYSDFDATWVYPNSTTIAAVTLRQGVPSPLAPRNDEEDDRGKDSDAPPSPPSPPSPPEADAVPPLTIDLPGLESRAVLLPPEAGNYSGLRAVAGKVVYQRLPRRGTTQRDRPILFYALEEREEKTIIDNATDWALSANGKKILVRQGDAWGIVDVAPGQRIKDRLATNELETVVDPRAEWEQLFTEVWRTYRDYFYDASLHGLNWPKLRRQYGSLLRDAATRWDVNFIIGELIGEVNASHTYVGGGDAESPRQRQIGLLGIDWGLDRGAYQVRRIVRGAPWDVENRSPLAAPGIEVGAGDYILAVNGRDVDPRRSPYAAFEGLAGETVALTVNDRPARAGARTVLIETLTSEARLRTLEWIEGNRRRVDEASGGRVGYVFVPNTGIPGQTELVRQFNSQITKAGLIIDERFNAGGQLPDRFIEQMNRPLVARLKFRYGAVVNHPRVSHYGPKVMLINGWAGSGGDAFPFFFKAMGVGPLVGERTWGGLIGPAIGHRLIDGGFYTAPPGRIYGADGVWFAEGHGVEPDIPVVDDPGQLARGIDPQLEAAIAEALRLIELNPVRFPDPPPFERRVVTDEGSGRGSR